MAKMWPASSLSNLVLNPSTETLREKSLYLCIRIIECCCGVRWKSIPLCDRPWVKGIVSVSIAAAISLNVVVHVPWVRRLSPGMWCCVWPTPTKQFNILYITASLLLVRLSPLKPPNQAVWLCRCLILVHSLGTCSYWWQNFPMMQCFMVVAWVSNGCICRTMALYTAVSTGGNHLNCF